MNNANNIASCGTFLHLGSHLVSPLIEQVVFFLFQDVEEALVLFIFDAALRVCGRFVPEHVA